MTRAGGSQRLVGGSPYGRIFIQDDIDRNARQHRRELGLVAESAEECAVHHLGQNLRSNPARHIDSTDGQGTQCKIPSLGAVCFCPKIQSLNAHPARVRARIFADLARGITAGAMKRWMTHVGIQKFVDGTNATAGKDVLATDLRQTLFQGSEKLDFAIRTGRKASKASLGREYAIPEAVPYQKSLTQAGTYGHQG